MVEDRRPSRDYPGGRTSRTDPRARACRPGPPHRGPQGCLDGETAWWGKPPDAPGPAHPRTGGVHRVHAREPDGAGTVSYVTRRPEGRQSDVAHTGRDENRRTALRSRTARRPAMFPSCSRAGRPSRRPSGRRSVDRWPARRTTSRRRRPVPRGRRAPRSATARTHIARRSGPRSASSRTPSPPRLLPSALAQTLLPVGDLVRRRVRVLVRRSRVSTSVGGLLDLVSEQQPVEIGSLAAAQPDERLGHVLAGVEPPDPGVAVRRPQDVLVVQDVLER